jgi:ABC-type nitrate/sulfonate/bicarbonate transport system substrate-binding protein
MHQGTRRRLAGGLVATALLASLGALEPSWAQEPPIPTIPRVSVRHALAPFLDHTDAIIAIRKGWFDEVGIEIVPKPHGRVLPSAERAANLIAGSVDTVSAGVYNLLPAMGKARNLRIFVEKDVSYGYRIMAQPDKGYKSFTEFAKEGAPPAEAFKQTVAQLKGKTITYLSEPSREQFIELVYRRGGLTKAEIDAVKAINVDDSQTVALMVSGRADFQFGGAPSMAELTKRGFKPILVAYDLVRTARPSADSEELLTILKVGWGTTAEFYEQNRDTLLRMASVVYRIARFSKEQLEEALAINVPFLNSVAGSQMTPEFGRWAYTDFHPYYTFEEQEDWYENPQSVFYYKYEVGARIKDGERKGIFKPGEMDVDTIVVADDVYRQLKELRAKARPHITEAKDRVDRARRAGKDVARAQELVTKAEQFFANYNFLDAERFAQAAVAWADFLARR